MADPTPKLPPMPEPDAAERSAFERWAAPFRSGIDGSYDYPLGRVLWACWQARATLPAREAAQSVKCSACRTPSACRAHEECLAQSVEQARELSDEARDAARYRWLRDEGSATWLRFQEAWRMSATQCDAAIDAQIAAAGAHQSAPGGTDATQS